MLSSLNRFMVGKVSDTELAQSFDDMCVQKGPTTMFRYNSLFEIVVAAAVVIVVVFAAATGAAVPAAAGAAVAVATAAALVVTTTVVGAAVAAAAIDAIAPVAVPAAAVAAGLLLLQLLFFFKCYAFNWKMVGGWASGREGEGGLAPAAETAKARMGYASVTSTA